MLVQMAKDKSEIFSSMVIPALESIFCKEIPSMLITETILPVNPRVDNRLVNTTLLRELILDMLNHRLDHIRLVT